MDDDILVENEPLAEREDDDVETVTRDEEYIGLNRRKIKI